MSKIVKNPKRPSRREKLWLETPSPCIFCDEMIEVGVSNHHLVCRVLNAPTPPTGTTTNTGDGEKRSQS